jgi:site-specific DNA-methyltransferase (adenine-specific)
MSFTTLIQGDVEDVLPVLEPVHLIFADVPDNIGLEYNSYKDTLSDSNYLAFLHRIVKLSLDKANIIWVSYNAKWALQMGKLVQDLLQYRPIWEAKLCVQVFTFGQNRQTDLTNCYRPLLRLKKISAPLYPDKIRIPSWRQEHGDKRADERGKVATDVFDFPRVTGNSKQRRKWHPTQLNEGLVERCLKFCCKADDVVIDLFSGTGTTLRVCRQLDLPVIAIELDALYCENIAADSGLEKNPNPFPWQASWFGY